MSAAENNERTRKLEELVDINDVVFDQSLPVPERIQSVVEQMNGDPYHFRTGDVKVTVRFGNECTLGEAVAHYLATRDNCGTIE